ncbi:type VI secretion system amidase effector protein Tae4 [Flavobacterium sp.]|uniref:type VI secretion system amidase effector protein Tae4 n=1 Tax=Flavobacterium sp. TaxID=239 RepID=UPI00263464FA|nr:type VI secretion system amidase effector protein Tae4 [Flavobacterium sp.]MDD3005438.1 type VI secretion system amidase effector protein Tae4 [Flavobacterium sp.]
MSDFKEFKNPWSAENSEWFGEEKDKWFEGGEYTEWLKELPERKNGEVFINSNLNWDELSKNYPSSIVSTKELYNSIKGGLPENLARNPASWENSCAIRMSRGLNYSGVKLPKASSNGGNIIGDDKFNYWIRVKDLKEYLIKLLQNKFTLIEEVGGINAVEKFKNKKGIIVFDVSGWSNATGHFTLWDGTNLFYVGPNLSHNDPNSEYYYFSMNYITSNGTNIKTTNIRLWEIS